MTVRIPCFDIAIGRGSEKMVLFTGLCVRGGRLQEQRALLLIGIDEARYGPLLGPLCHGLAVWRYEEDEVGQEAPDLWDRFKPEVARSPAPASAIEVDDSKKVFFGGDKLRRLSRSVYRLVEHRAHAPAGASHAPSTGLQTLLPRPDLERVVAEPWGQPPPEPLEEGVDAEPFVLQEPSRKEPDPRALAKALRRRLEASRATLLAYEARAMMVRDFNARVGVLQNKAEVSWERIGELLLYGVRFAWPGEKVVAVVDRQGGRKFYAAPLGDVFPGAFVRVLHEDAGFSEYRVEHRESEVRVGFQERADAKSLPVAMASMAAKLVRELLMVRFNAYFRRLDADVKPTAGYYKDGLRFLEETGPLRKALELPDVALIRQR